jgi:hypothetical protein
MKNILLVLISFVIIGCRTTVSPVTNTVDLTSLDFSNARNLKEAKMCEKTYLGFIGPFGNAKIITAIRKYNIKKVYAVDIHYTNLIIAQKRCVFVYGEEMTLADKRKMILERIKKKKKKK